MFTYYLKFDNAMMKSDLESALKPRAGFKKLNFIFDKFKGTPRGYAFASYSQEVVKPAECRPVADPMEPSQASTTAYA
ncbi:hypothetical protein Ciccas_008891 [Cichlidogyrus casuarinus]|uniref:Uncharacterized protein n=1 Tax=Cichlidogyrus casuarinus TaxID=1844966 RepID=A0ABD2Q009_9PLAT